MQSQSEWVKTKIFKNGNSLAVRIPGKFNVQVEDCYVRLQSNGDIQMRIHKQDKLVAFDALAGIEDFPAREQPPHQAREELE